MSTAVEMRDLGLPPVSKFPVEKNEIGLELERRIDSKSTAANGFFIEEEEEEEGRGVSSESSLVGPVSSEGSSIGENSSSEAGEKEGEGEEDEVQSNEMKEGLGSLDSLEDSLPIKRGLSNFYAGKSKSFTSLAEASSNSGAKDLAKPENPFNKRRRILTAWSRRASCSSLVTSSLPPLFAPDHTVTEENEEEEEEDEQDENGKGCKHKVTPTLPPLGNQRGMMMMVMRKSFKSPRSFSLSDLQHAK